MGVEGCKIMVHEKRKKNTCDAHATVLGCANTSQATVSVSYTDTLKIHFFLYIVLQISHFFSGVCKALE